MTMATAKQSLDEFLDQERATLVSDCTACGKCVEVCPVDVCLPDPNRVETEEQLLAKIKK